MKFLNYTLIILAGFYFFSCTSSKEIVYLQNVEKDSITNFVKNYESVYQPDDLLRISVTASDIQAVMPFNQRGLPSEGMNQQSQQQQQNSGNSYLLDKEGNIQMPILGTINLLGKTRTEAIKIIESKLKTYVKDPVVLIFNENNKISVLGDVRKSGTINFTTERITILEALALAGDLNITGKRDNILIIRDNNGDKTYNRINLLDPSIMNSEFYYLKKNDVVYVEPNMKEIRNADKLRADLPFVLSIGTSLVSLLSIVLILTRN